MLKRAPSSDEVEATIAFVDISGFTALTEAHGDRVAADTAERLIALVRRSLSGRDRLVKTTGDGAFLASPDPAHALEVLARLFADWQSEPLMPQLRAGLHHGPALARQGDVYGATVNIAARICAQAEPGQVLASRAVVARSARPSVDLGRRSLAGVRAPVQLFALPLAPALQDTTVDPVCRMLVCPLEAHGPVVGDGATYWFCSVACADYFRHGSAGTEVEVRCR